MSSLSLIISCGGTGGHFYPGLSIARECLQQNLSVKLYLAGHHSQNQQKQAQNFNIESDIGAAVRLPNKIWKWPYFFIIFTWTTFTSMLYLLRQKPKAVLVMGSFASVPLGLAAVLTFTPLFLHEGNSVIGKANRFLSRWAKKLYLSYPVINSKVIHCPMQEVGMPIRPEIENAPFQTSENCKSNLGFEAQKPLLLVFGGSQGAMRINNALYESLKFLSKEVQLLHLTGQADNTCFEQKAKDAKIKAVILTGSSEMQNCLRASDLIICRAGASSLAEIAFFQKSALFIPLKIAAENHQFHNAELAEKINAGKILIEDELTPENLASHINDWLNDRTKWDEFAQNMVKLKREKVSESIIKSIMTSC